MGAGLWAVGKECSHSYWGPRHVVDGQESQEKVLPFGFYLFVLTNR